MSDDFERRLRQLMGELGDTAPRPSDWSEISTTGSGHTSRRPRFVAMLAAAAALVLVVGGVTALFALRGTSGDVDPAPPAATDPVTTTPTDPVTTTPTDPGTRPTAPTERAPTTPVPDNDSVPPPSAVPSTAAPRDRLDDEFPPAAECPLITPEVLPNGEDPGEPRPHPPDNPLDHLVAWGTGRNEVTLGRGQEMLDGNFMPADEFREAMETWPQYQRVTKDDVDRLVVPVGDPPLGAIGIRFIDEGCPYTLSLPGSDPDGGWRGYEIVEAMEYAARF